MTEFKKTLLNDHELALQKFITELAVPQQKKDELIALLDDFGDFMSNILADKARTDCIAAGTHMTKLELNKFYDNRENNDQYRHCAICTWRN